ncbi:hypothetical protein BO86DRAFT_8427 [Aspergillus japonicus CBS 114.51]|uniref:Uncharacterized protein n=1 Tax=Aspergillus japonicus CBS 114.51 TaxID=1448312 RepID=A0A8T8XHX6_ASPJA|nr:hypothetical protein BO86DRAFT_8427 [Aspergillus japonicus CBS 114.51]RAH87681.1 hypothetical protein BO86DRAFT_8427 [Aspergillus japonicus CBS 114.51]
MNMHWPQASNRFVGSWLVPCWTRCDLHKPLRGRSAHCDQQTSFSDEVKSGEPSPFPPTRWLGFPRRIAAPGSVTAFLLGGVRPSRSQSGRFITATALVRSTSGTLDTSPSVWIP